MALLTCEQFEDRLAALHRASLELVSDLSLDTVLERIVNLAREEVNASYAALGVLDESGHLSQFIPVGMDKHEMNTIGNFPVGEGLIGALQRERKTIRVPRIGADTGVLNGPGGSFGCE